MADKRANLRFYNMLAHLVKNNRLYEENLAVKNIWKKGGNIFLDLYFYRTKKSRIIDGAFVHDLLDLNNECYYASAEALWQAYQKAKRNSEKKSPPKIDNKILAAIEVDLVIFTFISTVSSVFSRLKKKAIRDYLVRHQPASANLSEQYVNSYLSGLKPNVEDFYDALERLKEKTPEQATEIFKEALKISMSDGTIHLEEKFFLAEILQTLREYNLEPDINL